MIKVTALYPNGADARFDMPYYLSRHIPMVKEKLGVSLKGVSVDEGLSGVEPGSAPRFIAAGHLFFESLEAFQLAFATHGGAIIADLPNYTNTQPMVQISDVKM
jgi:uncharacterized protein (TIGR02118 family)